MDHGRHGERAVSVAVYFAHLENIGALQSRERYRGSREVLQPGRYPARYLAKPEKRSAHLSLAFAEPSI